MTRHAKIATPAILFIAFFAAWLPTLNWLQFYNSIENIVVETALETRRDGGWLIPRMHGEPRTRKPPLAAWASALCARRQTIRELSDSRLRETAYARLAREMRMPALLAACLTIAATWALGHVLAGQAVGVGAGVITATSLLFLEYARLATPDVYLALWVTCCNVMLALAVFRRQRWSGCCGAGICLGLAIMSKGPIALLQTIAPLGLFLQRRGWDADLPRRNPNGWILPVLAGIGLFFCVALPWPARMMAEVPGVWRTWFGEFTRFDPADPRPDAWYVSFHLFRHFMPWTLWMILGVFAAAISASRRERKPVELALWLFAVPVIVMAFFPERKPRYILPMIPPGAVLAAWAMVHVVRGSVPAAQRWCCLILHGLLVTLLVAGLAWAGAARLRTIDGLPWFTPYAAVAATATILALVVGGVILSRREWPLLGTTAAAMLLFDVMLTVGLSRSQAGRSDMKPLADTILRRAPNAAVWSVHPGDPEHNAPPDLSIYLNRVVKRLTAVDKFPASDVDEIVVIASAQRSPAPSMAPSDWSPLGMGRRGAVYWHAFHRIPVSSARTPE